MQSKPHPKLVTRANTRFLCIRYYDESGRRKFLSTGFEDEKRALGELANFIKHEERERLSVAPSVFECLKYYAENHKISGTYDVQKDINLINYFGQMPANTISKQICRSYVKHRTSQKFKRKGWSKAKNVSEASAGRELRGLSAAVKFCVSEGFCPTGSVFSVPSIQSKGKLHITKEEARLIFEACPTFHVKLFMMLALSSGHRMGAILDLTWDRVIFDKIHFINPERDMTKKRRGQMPVIDGSDLQSMLSEARVASETDYVIEHNGKKLKSIRRAVAAAGQRVGINYLTPHVLKHSACVWMAEGGVPLADISDLTVTDIKTIMDNYMIFTPARGKRAVSATQF